MNVTLAIDDEVLRGARIHAEAMGTSVNELVREYLNHLAGNTDVNGLWDEFGRLMDDASGDSGGWIFNRAELYKRG